jgi:hypothetical protein
MHSDVGLFLSLAITPAPLSTNRALQICRIVSIPFQWQSGTADKDVDGLNSNSGIADKQSQYLG